MIGGSIVVTLFLLVLGWTAEIVGVFVTDPATVGSYPALHIAMTDALYRKPFGQLLLPSSVYTP